MICSSAIKTQQHGERKRTPTTGIFLIFLKSWHDNHFQCKISWALDTGHWTFWQRLRHWTMDRSILGFCLPCSSFTVKMLVGHGPCKDIWPSLWQVDRSIFFCPSLASPLELARQGVNQCQLSLRGHKSILGCQPVLSSGSNKIQIQSTSFKEHGLFVMKISPGLPCGCVGEKKGGWECWEGWEGHKLQIFLLIWGSREPTCTVWLLHLLNGDE